MAIPTLEHLLVEAHIVSPVQLAVAKRDAEMRHRRLAPALIDLGLVDQERFAKWAAETSGLPLVADIPERIAAGLAARVPASVARQHDVLAVGVDGDELTVATIDPFDHAALELLHITTGMKIRAVVGLCREVTRLIERFYPAESTDSAPAPFEFGSDTLLAAHAQPLSIGDSTVGSSTQIFTPRPAPEGASQLDRIEARLAALSDAVQSLERKLAAIDSTLSRVLAR